MPILQIYISSDMYQVLELWCKNVHGTKDKKDMENMVEDVVENTLLQSPEYQVLKKKGK